jgi:hypothetical protein
MAVKQSYLGAYTDHALRQADRFSWTNTARGTLNVYR